MALRTFVMNTVKVARNFAIALAFMVFGAVGVTAQNTGTVTGLVRDATTLAPLAGAQVAVEGTVLDQLKTVRFRNQDQLQKLGNHFYAPIRSDDVPIPSREILVRQGILEQSNVNTVLEMSRMITATRSYEMVQKAITNLDSLDEKAITISRVS